MSVKIKSVTVIAARVVLGLIYFVFGLNFFLHFIPTPQAAMSAQAEAFTSGLFQSGFFFPFLKSVEVIFGALLLVGLFVPVSLAILMPVSINILLFHAALAPDNIIMSVVIIVVHLFLAWAYRDSYKSLFVAKAPATL